MEGVRGQRAGWQGQARTRGSCPHRVPVRSFCPLSCSFPERVGPTPRGFSGAQSPPPCQRWAGGGVAEEMAGGQLRALLCTPYMVPHWVAGMVWGHRETRWQDGLPEGQGRWERVRATAEGEHDQEEHPEQHASLRRLLQDDRRRRSSVATAMGMPFAGGAQPWARLCASLSPCPLEAVRQEKEPRLRTELGSSAAFTSIEL